MPPAGAGNKLEFPQGETLDPDLQPSPRQPVLLGPIEAVNDIQVTTANDDSGLEVQSALFVGHSSSAGQVPARIQDESVEPTVIPELARQNHSPWLWWLVSAFGTGFGLCWAGSLWFRRPDTY